MKKYEYRVGNEYFNNSVEMTEFAKTLEEEQKDGWEFVSVLTNNRDYFTYLLKKQVNN